MALPRGTTGSLWPSFDSARRVSLAVRLAYAIALNGRCPTALSQPSRASVTVWEATAPVKLPTSHRPQPGFTALGEAHMQRRVVFHRRLHRPRKGGFAGSHLSYAAPQHTQWQARVKLHGVFLSGCGLTASSPPLQFHRAPDRDSAHVVMPFVRVGTYPTRNFATLGPL